MFSLVFFNGSFECRVIWFLQLLQLMSFWTRDRRGCWKSNWGRDVTLRLLLMHMHVSTTYANNLLPAVKGKKIIRSSFCRGHSHAFGTGLPASSSACKINILHSNSFWKKIPCCALWETYISHDCILSLVSLIYLLPFQRHVNLFLLNVTTR